MPLRVTKGIPIAPKATAPVPVAVGLKSFALGEVALAEAAAPAPPGKDLKIKPVVQKQSQWCWAACVEMVLAHYQRHQNQCAIVAAKLELDDNNPHDCCNREDDFALASCENLTMDEVWRHFQMKTDLEADGVTPLQVPLGQVEFSKIQEEIDNGHPLEVGIKWNIDRGGGHAVLIVGWTFVKGKPAVLVNDPLPTSLLGVKRNGQSGTILLSDLQKGHGYGTWVHTWTGLVPEDNHA